MSPQFSTDQDAVTFGTLPQSARWTGLDALSAGKALRIVNQGDTILNRNGIFFTDLHAGPALGAGFIRDFGSACTDEPQVNDLGT